MIGTKIEVPKGAKIPACYRRNGRGICTSFLQVLPPGQYIVDFADTEGWDEEEEELRLLLAHAEWDKNGKVTYHSNKHLYLVRRRDLKITIDLLEAVEVPA